MLHAVRLTLVALASLSLAGTLSGCGFQPLYATATADDAAPINRLIMLGDIRGPDDIQPEVAEALSRRIIREDGVEPRYQLNLNIRQAAAPLAIQIDATVRRYNYRLRADYQLDDLETGETYRGRANVFSSYNIVSSQYSTLFAERNAREKAARLLAEEIERDILLGFTENGEFQSQSIALDPESEILSQDDDSEAFDPLLMEE